MKSVPAKSPSPLSLTLIGAGGFGSYHLASIGALSEAGRIRLDAVVEPGIDRMPRLKADLKAKGVRLFLDYEQWLAEDCECDAVTIAAPIPFHFEIASRCIERGLIVYLEKPPVPLLEQLESLIDLDKNRRVYVGFQFLCYGWMRQLKAWIVEGRFGELRSIRAGACWNRTDKYYTRCGWSGKMMFQGRPTFDGPATNALAHLVHSIMYLASSSPGGFSIPSQVRGELYRARKIESYDTASMCGAFPSGPDFSLTVTHATEREHPYLLSIDGTDGWAKISSNGARMETSFAGVQMQAERPEVLRASYEAFADFAEGRLQEPHTTLADCRGYIIATNGMLLSSEVIHDIPEEYVSTYGVDGESGFAIRNIADAVKETVTHGGTLSDHNIPWAVTTKAVSPESIAGADMLSRLKCQSPVCENAHEPGPFATRI